MIDAGASSSGIIEAPSLKTPTVNIGDRQKGRIKAQSIIDCTASVETITRSLKKALSNDFRDRLRKISNPHEKKGTASRIKEILKQFDFYGILKKKFYDISFTME